MGLTIGIDHFEFNPSKNEWIDKEIKMQVRNKHYQGITVKNQIAKKLKKNAQNIEVYYYPGIGADVKLKDDERIHPKHQTFYRVYDKLTFNIKYFYGNSKLDIIFQRNYKMVSVDGFCCDKLIDIINDHVTNNKIILTSLICHKLENKKDENMLVLRYINKMNDILFMDITQDIIGLISAYYPLTVNNLSLFESIMKNNINTGDTLILYKDFSNKYVRFVDIEATEKITIYIRDIDKKYGRFAEVHCDDEKQIEEVELQKVTINVLDTVEQLCNAIMKQLNIEKIEPHTIRYNQHLLNQYNKMDHRVITYGIEQDSVVHIHTIMRGS